MMVAYITSLASVEQKEDLVSVGLCALSQFPHIHDTLTDLTQVHPERPSQHWQPRRSIATIQFCRYSNKTWGNASTQLAHFWGLSAVPTPIFMPEISRQTSSHISLSSRHVFGSSSWPVRVARLNMSAYHSCRSMCTLAPLQRAIGRQSGKIQSIPLLQQQA